MKKQAIVIGASRGIGLALSRQLIANDYRVIGTSRTGSVGEIEDADFNCLELDITQPISIENFANVLKEQNLRIDLLINNTGIGPDLELDMPEETSFAETFDVNVKGIVMLTEKLISLVVDGGKILNVSSKMGSITHCQGSDAVAYRMSKTALNMYTKILANRLSGKISVAAIHPGWVQTTITESCINARLTPDESASRILDYVLHRFENGDFWDAEAQVKLKW